MQASFPFTTPSDNRQISTLDFEGAPIRITDVGGAPWFLLTDVCAALEIRNHRHAASRINPEDKGVVTTDTLGGPQKTAIINESGLYALTFDSRKPEAKRFRTWVTSVVLPSIRRTGSYHIRPALEPAAPSLPPALAQQALAVINDLQILLAEQQMLAEERLETIQYQNDLLSHNMPKARVHDRIADADGSMCISDAAKILGVGPRSLVKWMDAHNWIFRRGRDSWLGREEKSENGAGYLTHIVTTILHPDGREITRKQVRVTAKGLTRLGRLVPGAVTKGMPIPAPAQGVVRHGGLLRGNRRSQEPVEMGLDEMDVAGRGAMSCDEFQRGRSIH